MVALNSVALIFVALNSVALVNGANLLQFNALTAVCPR